MSKTLTITDKQHIFIRYIIFILVDLVVLGLFNEFWSFIYIESFSIALLTATLLQLLLQAAIKAEHFVSSFIKTEGKKARVIRLFSAWIVIFISKIIILEAINYFFGDSVVFSGPIGGLVAFIIVVTVLIIVEQIVAMVYRKLGDKQDYDLI